MHLIARLAVVTSDLPVHDWHHRHERSIHWPDALYERQRDIDSGCPEWGEPYTEVWGIGPAIDAVLGTLAVLDPDEQPVGRPLIGPELLGM